jgi:4-diphosphocytidyl-2C-methyl-D-erythritol kinase
VAAVMSGSGSAVFGLFKSRAAAKRTLRPLSKGGSVALLTRTLSRSQYERRSRPVLRRWT